MGMLVGLMLVLFGWSCERESVPEIPPTHQSSTQLRSTETCRCYMQVRSVSNAPGNLAIWYLWDFTGDTNNEDFLVQGQQSNWIPPNGVPTPLPTPWIQLVEPSADVSKLFEIGAFPLEIELDNDFTIHTRVECREVNPDGSEVLPGTIYLNVPFRHGDGVDINKGNARRIRLNDGFSCLAPIGPNNQ